MFYCSAKGPKKVVLLDAPVTLGGQLAPVLQFHRAALHARTFMVPGVYGGRIEERMIYIIRHGQTEGNAAKLLQGRHDNPLNEMGVEQARIAGEQLRAAGIRFSRIYSSPLSRAIRTAGIVAGDVDQVIDERLIEMDYGPYEGMRLDEPAPEVLAFFKDFARVPAPAGMEPLADIVARLGEFLEDIRSDAAEQNILVSTHAIAMKGALEYLTPDSCGSYWSTYIKNCAVYVCGIDAEGAWTVPYEWIAPAG